MHFHSSFECTIEGKHVGGKVVTWSVERKTLSITVAPVASTRRVVTGNATAVQASTIGSSVIAHFGQCVTAG
jgi:hypothetical protein